VCTQYYIVYSCGCHQDTDFDQCDKLLDTDLKCPDRRIQDVEEKSVDHYCEAHLVEYPGGVKMAEDEDEDEHDVEEQEQEQEGED
jgi:hypothetical protein